MGYLYLIKSQESGTYKIGITKNSPEKRLKTLQTGNSDNLILIDSYYSRNYKKIETQLHRNLKSYKIQGEWFLLNEDFNFQENCKKVEEIITVLSDNPFY